METKKCEICGRELPVSDFSKSYKNRCRECVAAHTREVRHKEKISINADLTESVDWESRRYDLTKSAMVAMIDKRGCNRAAIIAMDAVEIADEVIKELQKGGKA